MNDRIDLKQIPQNEIWYTTHDGKPLDNKDLELRQNSIISNSYSDGKGVVVYKNNIKIITGGFLSFCDMAKSISLPWGVEKIKGGKGSSLWFSCGIEKIDLPDTIVEIYKAFNYCDNLTQVQLPCNLETIDYCFMKCANLKKFEGKYASGDGRCLIVKNRLVTFARAGLTEYTIPKNVKAIDWFVFDGCSALKRIVLPEGLTSIGGGAFEDCTSLVDISLPPKVRRIGDDAFKNCRSLKNITIPSKMCENYVSLGDGIFSGCTNLESVTFDSELITVPFRMFDDCTNLKEVKFAEKPHAIARFAFRNCTSLTSIEYRATANVDLDAFVGCDNLTIINGQQREKKVCIIERGTLRRFLDNDAVQYTTPDNVTSIGSGAFSDCTSLTSVTISDSVTEIEFHAFNHCKSLKSVTIGKNVQTIDMFAFEECENLESVIFNDGLQKIKKYAFQNCSKLSNIVLPEGLQTIEEQAFANCASLVSVTFPSTLVRVSKDVFVGCHNLERFYGENISEDGRCLILHEIVRAFAPANLTEYAIPDGVRGVDSGFTGCKNLEKLTFPPTVQTFPVLMDCSNLRTVNIPEGVRELDSSTFVRCENLTSITIPNSINKIWHSTFNDCTGLRSFRGKFSSADHHCLIIDGELMRFAPAGLTEYTIPEGVTTIGWQTFAYNNDLERITLPESVEQIDEEAFYNCKNLKEVYIKSDKMVKIDDSSFQWVPPFRIYVPNKKLKTYQKSKKWARCVNSIVGYDF